MMDDRKPRLIILAGPNGSGKSTFAAQLNDHPWGAHCRFLNADELAEQLGGWNNPECVAEAQIRIRGQLQLSLLNREDIMYETVFSHPSKLTLIRQARELGYFVRLFFICTESPRINIDRVAERFAKGGAHRARRQSQQPLQPRTDVWGRCSPSCPARVCIRQFKIGKGNRKVV